MRTRRRRTDESQPIPVQDLDTAQNATTEALWKLNVRFVLLAVALNILVAAGVVIYTVYNDQENTRVFLTDSAIHAAKVVQSLRKRTTWSARHIIDEASELTACEMALISHGGQFHYGTTPRLGYQMREQQWPNAETPLQDTRMLVDARLRELSGLWWFGRYDERFHLLVIVPRRPEDEGRVQYMTIAAGVTGAGVLATLFLMLIASNWMLRKPLVSHIKALTSALVRDVRRRKYAEERANQARDEAQQHLRFRDNLLDASEVMAIVATDHSGLLYLVNSAAERIFGIREKDVVGTMTLDELMLTVQPDNSAVSQDTLHPFVGVVDGEQQIQDREGKTRTIQVSMSSIKEPDASSSAKLMVFTDITEQKRVEAELKSKQMQLIQSSRMATLGEMAAGVAHEINQPLNNIGLLSSRAIRKLEKKRNTIEESDIDFFKGKLGTIQEQVKRAAKIIDHLRVFGRADPQPLSDIDVEQAIHGSLELLGEQLALHDIELDIDIAEDLPKAIADLSRLEQVLINLIVNARYALEEREVTLRAHSPDSEYTKRLSLRAFRGLLGREADRVIIEVEDNGHGMTDDVSSRVFEPFFTTKEVGKGTGLGLSISYGIVREFGGMLAVRSRPEAGTTFSILLPLSACEGTES